MYTFPKNLKNIQVLRVFKKNYFNKLSHFQSDWHRTHKMILNQFINLTFFWKINKSNQKILSCAEKYILETRDALHASIDVFILENSRSFSMQS